VIQRQEPFQDFRIGQRCGPAVRREDCFVQLAVDVRHPCGLGVVHHGDILRKLSPFLYRYGEPVSRCR
jgi:hypothetical protein